MARQKSIHAFLPLFIALFALTFGITPSCAFYQPAQADASPAAVQSEDAKGTQAGAGDPFLTDPESRPALVVGVMVDQLRPDYVSRFWDKLSEGGFRRLVREGFTFTNMHYNYLPTATGPGHASVHTGTTPSNHGVMGNAWYVRDFGRSINVIEVDGYEGVGTAPDYNGNKSPGNMLTTTVGDELRLHTNFRSKVVSVSRKDRGAILPGGHTGDAYWFEGSTGNFITSTYYRDELPEWLQEFNARRLAWDFLSRPWETLMPIEEYIESIEDDNPYETLHRGEESPTFPHDLPGLVANHGATPSILASTPFGDELVLEVAIAAMEGENLGRRGITDMINISFSSTDGVGHAYGPASIEIQDQILRLDRYIERLLNYLDENYGMENILLFLTSDHGVSHVVSYLADQGIPAGQLRSSEALSGLRQYMTDTWGEDFYLAFTNFQIYLDHEKIAARGLDLKEVRQKVADYMLSIDRIAGALTYDDLRTREYTHGVRRWVQNGFNPKRSGDVFIWLEPHETGSSSSRGATHGSPWAYDTHAPGFWIGGLVPAGSSAERVAITDFAPTVSTFLQIPFPSGTSGRPLNDLMRKGAR